MGCAVCGRASTHDFGGLARCDACAAERPVEGPGQLRRPTDEVLGALTGAGVTISSSIHVELRSLRVVRTALAADHVLGLTRTKHLENGQRAGRIVVTVVAGLPEALFRQVFAHELGHAILYDRHIFALPDDVAEGMAEFFAHVYLTRDGASATDRLRARAIETNPEPVYGDGFRAVRRAIDRHGFRTVFVALYRGELARIGLR